MHMSTQNLQRNTDFSFSFQKST